MNRLRLLQSQRGLALTIAGLAACLALATVPACGSTSAHQDHASSSEGDDPEGEVTVLAAASLTQAFDILADRFEEQHPNVEVRTSFGASSALAQQIRNGAPADVFAAADTTTMDSVADDGLTQAQPRVFAHNRLQIAVPHGNPADVRRLADFARADLTTGVCARQVPCGRAAQRAFSKGEVQARPDTYGQDVKAILSKVREGELDAGLVYASDVHTARGKVDGIDFAEAKVAVNDYPIATLQDAPNPKAAGAFAAFVRSEASADVLSRTGFQTR